MVHQLWSSINTVSEIGEACSKQVDGFHNHATSISQSHTKMYLLSCSLPLNIKALQVVILFDFVWCGIVDNLRNIFLFHFCKPWSWRHFQIFVRYCQYCTVGVCRRQVKQNRVIYFNQLRAWILDSERRLYIINRSETLEITRLLLCYRIKFNVLLKLWLWTDNIVISGKIFVRSTKLQKTSIVIWGISLYRRSLYRGSVLYILL